MKNGLIYKLNWLTAKNAHEVVVDIYDTNVQIEDADTVEVINLTPAGSPLTISVIDNDKSKLTPVRAKQATIQFISTPNYDITTFAQGPDNRWYVEAYLPVGLDNYYLLKGYLSLSDMSQDFQPNPNIVTLVASDHLGILRDIPLTDSDGNYITGYHKISYILANALRPTGLSLTIDVQNNLRHGTGDYTAEVDFVSNTVSLPAETSFFYPGQYVRISGTASNNGYYHVKSDLGILNVDLVSFHETFVTESNVTATFQDRSSETHLYDYIYLDTKTFEKEIGEAISCREALEMILKEGEVLFQHLGKWVIQRIDEQDGNPFYFGTFNSDGTFSTFDAIQSYLMDIGDGENVVWADHSCLIQIDGEDGKVRETYQYQTPIEIVANIDFDRGDLSSTITDTEKRYEIDNWVLREGYPGFYGTVDGSTAYVTRKFNNIDYETERYATVTPRTTAAETATQWTYLESEGVPIHEKDRFTASVDWRLPSDIGAGGNNYWLLQIILFGDDGSYWILGNVDISPDTYNQTDYKWWDTSGFTTNTSAGRQPIDFDTMAEDEFINLSWDAPPAPVSGEVYLWLHQFNQDSGVSTDNVNIDYANLRFEYIPYINGSYRKYNSQYNENSRGDTDYMAKREESVEISDSPKKLFKGAMFIPTVGAEIFDGTITFVSGGLTLPGDLTGDFRPGKYIYIDSPTHNGHWRILTSTYNIIGSTTALTLYGSSITTITEAGVIHRTSFVLANRFYTSHVFAQGNPTDFETECKTYGKQQVDAAWNQYRNSLIMFSGNLYGLPRPWPDLTYKFSMTDTNPNTINRYFIMIAFEQDWGGEKWRADFIEVYNTVTGKVYDDPHEFKYISDNG